MKPSKLGGLAKLASVALLTVFVIASSAPAAMAAAQRVVVLPFTANAKNDVSYLVQGIRDMLASRLAWQDKVTVIEPDLVAPVLKKFKQPLNEAKAKQLGEKLQADAVVFGTITALGKSVSVDARVVRTAGKSPALTTYVQAADMDQVIPQINDFAQRINAELFQRPDAVAARKTKADDQGGTDRSDLVAQPKSPAEQWQAKNQGRPTDVEKLPPNISPLNPLFMRTLSGVESDRYWRSPRLKGAVTSLAVDDIDLDGRNELIVLLQDRIRVYRLTKGRFDLLQEFKNGPDGEYLFVDTADIDGDGRPEIFVSCVYETTIMSFVMTWEKSGLRMRARDLPWYFRVQPDPKGKGKILWGQQRNMQDAYSGPVYRMHYKDKSYVPGEPIKLPEFGNIYNFVRADLNGGGDIQTVMVGPGWRLEVFGKGNRNLYQSAEIYAGSGKYILSPPGTAVDVTGDEEVWHFVPTRLLINDLDGDGRQEIVVVRNKDSLGGIAEKMRFFYQGTIFSLYWNGLSLLENWRTPRISGYITDYAIADVGNVGRPALVLSLVRTGRNGIFGKGNSHVVAFTLKPKAIKGKRKKQKGL